MRRWDLSVAVAVLSLIAGPVGAFEVTIVATSNGQPVPHAQVCFFPSDASSPVARHFRSNDVRCMSADTPIELPPGSWNFYAKREPDLISDWGGRATIGTGPGTKRIVLALQPAGTVDVSRQEASLRRGEWLTLYFPGNTDRPGFSLPVPAAASSMLVPADHEFLPVLVRSGTPIRIGAVTNIGASQQLVLPALDRTTATRDVLAWVATTAKRDDRVADPPRIVAKTKEGAIEPLCPFNASDPDVVLFKSLPRVPITLELSGRSWETDTVVVPAGAEVAVAPRALQLVSSLHLAVDVALDRDLLARPDVGKCGEPVAKSVAKSVATLRLLSCPAGAESEAAGCRLLDQQSLKPGVARQTVSFPRMTSSANGLELIWPGAPALFQPLPVRSRTAVLVQRYTPVSGRVTADGVPAAAHLRFGNGEAVSDAESGRYIAWLHGDPGSAAVRITPCGSERVFRFLSDTPLLGNAIADFELRETATPVRVVDPDEHPVEGATVTLQRDAQGGGTSLPGGTTDAAGMATITNLTLTAPVKVCATRPPFRVACSTAMTLPADHEVVLTLQRSNNRSGRVTGVSLPIAAGRLFWVAADGTIAQDVVAADGTFSHRDSSALYAVLVSRSHPLAAIDAPPAGTDPLELAIPAGPVLRFTVEAPPTSPTESAELTLRIGDLTVPHAAFLMHQGWRSQQAAVLRGRPLPVADVLATAPVSVLQGNPETPPEGGEEDPFLNPGRLRTFALLPVPTGAVVVLR